ncbi:MAG: histidine kinase dimerization/phospho-acceptor domain-containing protein, partial [Bacteroidota bacterium]
TDLSCFVEGITHNLSSFPMDLEGNIYLASSDLGLLYCYNPKTKTCKSIKVGVPFYRFTILKNDVLALVHGQTKRLYYFDLSAQQLRPAMAGDSILSFNTPAFQLQELSDGFLWIGTGNGLWKVNTKTNEAIQPHPDLPFQKDQIYYINETKEGILWLGTGNGGVQVYDPKTGSLKIVDESQGLSNNTVTSILEDDAGVRWVNTYNGVNLISPEGDFLTKLYALDGLANSEGNRFSSLKTQDGKILFGSISGTTLIDPERAKQQFLSGKELKIFLNQISYYDQKLKKDTLLIQQLDRPVSVVLPPAHRYLKLRVALSDLQRVEENQFSYRLEWQGKEQASEWIFVDNQSELNLTNLPAGKYDVVVKGTNYRGQQVKEYTRIHIHAKEFFYRTTWFYVLVLLSILSLPLLRLIQERLERRRLELLVSERTREIEQDKQVIEEQAEQLRALDQFKSRLFTNISHEFRTPLTVISGMLDQIEKKPASWLKKGTKIIRRNNANLLDLVNQMLELQKLESGKLEVNWQLGNIIPFLQTIFEQFQAYAQSKVQQMDFITEVEELQMDFDEEKVLRIVSNLLSNAIKYTPRKDRLVLKLQLEKHQN